MLADFSFSSSSRPSTASVPRRTSSTTILAQCSLPDLNHDHPRPVLSAGPQSRPSTPSVPCRASTTTIHVQCSLPDVDHDHPRPSVRCRTPTEIIPCPAFLPDPNAPLSKAMPDRMSKAMPARLSDSLRDGESVVYHSYGPKARDS